MRYLVLQATIDILGETVKTLLPVFAKLWWLWLMVLVVAVIKLIIGSPRYKGMKGEREVIKNLSRLPEDKYLLLNDVLIPSKDSTAQIDHIVISPKGVFVIETKNYSGIISGSENSSNWTQNIYGNKKTFKNPVHQNYGHIKALEKALESFAPVNYYSVVAFSDKSKLNIKSEKTPVVYFSNIADCILETESEVSIDMEKMQAIKDILNSLNITDKEERKAHNNEAHTKKIDAETKVREGICPICGEKLVVRNGRNGKFYGCSAYPKCHYTHNIH